MSDRIKEEGDLFDDTCRQNGLLLQALDTIAEMAAVAGNGAIVAYVGKVLDSLAGGLGIDDALKKPN